MSKKAISRFIVGTFVTLYLMVSIISTIHVIEFFKLSNPEWLAISLAVSFEVGAAASLASLIAIDKMNKTLVWSLFIILTAIQGMGNTYYAFVNLADFSEWSSLFDIIEEDPVFQKRILSIISGAILPVVALGFIKSLVDYIKPTKEESIERIIEKRTKNKSTQLEFNFDEKSEEEKSSTFGPDSDEDQFGVISSDHYGHMENANSNKQSKIKRYPTNLE